MLKAFLAALLVNSAVLAPTVVAEAPPQLKPLETALRVALSDVSDQVAFEYPARQNMLVVKYRTRRYMIHGGSMTGQRSEEAHEQDGPSYQGFMLRIYLQDAGEINQAALPQTIRDVYWQTELDLRLLEQDQKQVFTGLSYGVRVDRAVLDRVRKTLEAIGPRPASLGVSGAARPMEAESSPEPSQNETLEGVLRIHPKFAYRYYIDGFGDGQACALFEADRELVQIQPGSVLRVQGRLGSKKVGGNAQTSAIAATWIIYMDVQHVSVLRPASETPGRFDGESPPRSKALPPAPHQAPTEQFLSPRPSI